MPKFLAFSSLYIALNALALSLFYQIISGSIHIPRAITIFLATFISYSAVQLFPLKNKQPRSERSQWILSHRKVLIWSMSLCSVLILALIPLLDLEDILNFAHLFVLALFYEQVISSKNIRSIPYAKPFLISYVWTMACAYPSYSESLPMLALLECFLFIFSLCLLFDLRDIEDDKAQDVVTFATRFGAAAVIPLASISFIAALILVFNLFEVGLISWILFLAIGIVTILKSRPSTADLYYLLAVDGLIGFKLLLLVEVSLK
ncbi:MAG: hypothetical protein KC478_07890 [Bacteriovoracaceae bacterium]|nr:hypothetical protein [Bacteriovoracaceae bacterium]